MDCEERGATLDRLPVHDGLWRSSPDSIKIEQCYNANAYIRPKDTSAVTLEVDAQCAKGHTGPVSNVYETNFVKSVTGESFECQPTTTRGAAALS